MTGSWGKLQGSNNTVTIVVPTTGGNSCKFANGTVQAVGPDEKASGDGMIRGEGHMRIR